MTRIAWSFSSLDTFDTCPRKYYLLREAKVVTDPPNEATKYGTETHKHFEDRIALGSALPEHLQKWEGLCGAVDAAKAKGAIVQTEQQICLNEAFNPVAWFAKDAWCRAVLDLSVLGKSSALVADYKTNKKPKPNSAQLRLFAAVLMTLHKHIDVVHTAFLWLQTDKTTKAAFTRVQVPAIWDEFNQKVGRIENAKAKNQWLPKPSGLCNGWCPAQGHCEFWRPKRS